MSITAKIVEDTEDTFQDSVWFHLLVLHDKESGPFKVNKKWHIELSSIVKDKLSKKTSWKSYLVYLLQMHEKILAINNEYFSLFITFSIILLPLYLFVENSLFSFNLCLKFFVKFGFSIISYFSCFLFYSWSLETHIIVSYSLVGCVKLQIQSFWCESSCKINTCNCGACHTKICFMRCSW